VPYCAIPLHRDLEATMAKTLTASALAGAALYAFYWLVPYAFLIIVTVEF